MLRFPERNDELTDNVNKMLLKEMDRLIDAFIADCNDAAGGKISRETLTKFADGFTEYYEDLFPECESTEECMRLFTGLYALLNSDYKFVPVLRMEYILAGVIRTGINEFAAVLEENAIEPIYTGWAEDMALTREIKDNTEITDLCNFLPEDKRTTAVNDAKEYIRAELEDLEADHNTCEDEDKIGINADETSDNAADDLDEQADAYVFRYEHFGEGLYDVVFWDDDYTFLDEFSKDQIDTLNEQGLDIGGPDEETEDPYYVPKKWWESKNFRYLSPEVNDFNNQE